VIIKSRKTKKGLIAIRNWCY